LNVKPKRVGFAGMPPPVAFTVDPVVTDLAVTWLPVPSFLINVTMDVPACCVHIAYTVMAALTIVAPVNVVPAPFDSVFQPLNVYPARVGLAGMPPPVALIAVLGVTALVVYTALSPSFIRNVTKSVPGFCVHCAYTSTRVPSLGVRAKTFVVAVNVVPVPSGCVFQFWNV
jgi:hypothetical protein